MKLVFPVTSTSALEKKSRHTASIILNFIIANQIQPSFIGTRRCPLIYIASGLTKTRSHLTYNFIKFVAVGS